MDRQPIRYLVLLEYHQFSAGGFRQPSLSGKAAAGSVSKLGPPVSLDVDFYSRPFQYYTCPRNQPLNFYKKINESCRFDTKTFGDVKKTTSKRGRPDLSNIPASRSGKAAVLSAS